MEKCPSCQKVLGELEGNSVLTAVCSTCKFKYHFVRGVLSSKSSKQVTIQRQTKKQIGIYERHYELRIDRFDGVRNVFSFKTSGKDDRFPSKARDVIKGVMTLREDSIEELLYFYNESNGESLYLNSPGERSAKNARIIAIVIGVAALFIPIPREYILINIIIGIALGVFMYIKLKSSFSPSIEDNSQELISASSSNLLYEKKEEVERKISKVEEDNKKMQYIFGKLKSIEDKILKIKDPIYEKRMASIEKAIKLITERKQVNDLIIEKYNRLVMILEVEIDSHKVNTSLDEDFIDQMNSKFLELKDLETKMNDLDISILAEEEVKRYIE